MILDINLKEKYVLCKVCEKPMTAIHGYPIVKFTCENPKCKGYLKRTPPMRKTLFGKVFIDTNEYKLEKK